MHEPAQRALRALYARAGRRKEARKQFESLQTLLKDELGVEAEPVTLELAAQIVAGRIADETAPVTFERPRHNLWRV